MDNAVGEDVLAKVMDNTDADTPKVTREEVERAVVKPRNGKAAGNDNIVAECSGRSIVPWGSAVGGTSGGGESNNRVQDPHCTFTVFHAPDQGVRLRKLTGHDSYPKGVQSAQTTGGDHRGALHWNPMPD